MTHPGLEIRHLDGEGSVLATTRLIDAGGFFVMTEIVATGDGVDFEGMLDLVVDHARRAAIDTIGTPRPRC